MPFSPGADKEKDKDGKEKEGKEKEGKDKDGKEKDEKPKAVLSTTMVQEVRLDRGVPWDMAKKLFEDALIEIKREVNRYLPHTTHPSAALAAIL